MANKIRVFSLLLTVIFLITSQLSEALIDRSITVNKGQSGFFSLNADDLVNDEISAEPTQPNPELNAVADNSTLQAPGRTYGMSVDPEKALEPRNIFQRIQDVIAAIATTLVLMVYNTISTYLLSYRQLLRIFKNIPEDAANPISPAIPNAAW